MKSKLIALFIAITSCIASPAFARATVPIINYENAPITTGSGKTIDVTMFEQAVKTAAIPYTWIISSQQTGQIAATLVVRNKHTIVVLISYAGDKYSISYSQSNNMNYEVVKGEAKIHPSYNKWVSDLKNAIEIELLKL